MGKLILVLGGARSGKSTYVEQKAAELGGDSVLFVATSETKDEEMRQRVAKHRAQRPSAWKTLEVPRDVASVLNLETGTHKVVLVDCMTFLVANHLLSEAGTGDDPFGEPSSNPFDVQIEVNVLAEVEALIDYAQKKDTELLVVSNEVGLGLVPPYELGRAYRDILGRANQVLARHAEEVILLVAGIPLKVK
jgi:adenosylcobinamide kinase / adenosylcobinamide-phosphate guanylyltransferase